MLEAAHIIADNYTLIIDTHTQLASDKGDKKVSVTV